MASRGAQIGNSNAANGRRFRDGIRRALARESGGSLQTGIDRICTQLVRAAFDGQQWALQELGNRLDGKPVAQLNIETQFRPVDVSAEPLSVEEWKAKHCIEGEAEDVTPPDANEGVN